MPSAAYGGACNLAAGKSIVDCGCRVHPWDRLRGGGWLECPPTKAPAVEPSNGHTAARLSGFTGDICADCQQISVVRNGTCLLCVLCGATSGCS